MKLTLTTVLNNLEGKPFKTQKNDENVDLTVRDVILGGLINGIVPGQQDSPEDKFKRYRLSAKVYDAPEVEVSAEDVTLIKKLCAHSQWGIVVYGRLVDELERLATPADKK